MSLSVLGHLKWLRMDLGFDSDFSTARSHKATSFDTPLIDMSQDHWNNKPKSFLSARDHHVIINKVLTSLPQ